MKWFTILFIMLLILVVIVANLGLGSSFFPFIYKISGGDKLGHFFLMGIFSFLVNYVLNTRKIQLFSINFLLGSFIVLSIVTIEEFSQIFIKNRAFSILDLIFDYTGIFVFGQFSAYISDRRNPEKH